MAFFIHNAKTGPRNKKDVPKEQLIFLWKTNQEQSRKGDSMLICIVYTKDGRVAGLWLDLERGKQAAKDIGGWYQIQRTMDSLKK